MKTNHLLFVLLISFFTTPLFAQNWSANKKGVTFGARAGVNFQTINGKNQNGNDLENGITTAFHAGVNAEVPLGTDMYLQPGVLFSKKGADLTNNREVKVSYIEVPVNLVYKPMLGTGNVVLGFGPYVGFGIGGNLEESNGTKKDVVFADIYNARPYEFRRMDAGGNLLAGYEFANNVSIQLNAQLGLVDINPNVTSNTNQTRWRNTGFGLSMGYRF